MVVTKGKENGMCVCADPLLPPPPPRSLPQGPYQNVFLQEMDVMNTLLAEMARSLRELQLGAYIGRKNCDLCV